MLQSAQIATEMFPEHTASIHLIHKFKGDILWPLKELCTIF